MDYNITLVNAIEYAIANVNTTPIQQSQISTWRSDLADIKNRLLAVDLQQTDGNLVITITRILKWVESTQQSLAALILFTIQEGNNVVIELQKGASYVLIGTYNADDLTKLSMVIAVKTRVSLKLDTTELIVIENPSPTTMKYRITKGLSTCQSSPDVIFRFSAQVTKL